MRKYYLGLCFALFCVGGVRAQSLPINEQDPFVIEEVIYDISGRTKEHALRHRLGSYEQKGFASQQALDDFITWYKIELENSHFFSAVRVEQSSSRITSNQTLVTISVTIKDSFPVFPLPWAIYSSSNGLAFGTDLRFGNTGGNLFDTIIAGWVQFPNRDGHLAWSDPTWQVKLQFSDIQAGPVRLAISNKFSDNNVFVTDRGEEMYAYRSMKLVSTFGIKYDINKTLELNSEVEGEYAFTNRTIFNHSPDLSYYRQPLQFGFTPSVQLYYNNAPFIDGAQQGNAAKVKLSYILSAPVIDYHLMHDFKIEAKYGHYWQPTSFFFPQIIGEFYYKTGVPDFELGRLINGVIDNQWRGNGGFSVSSAFLFRALNLENILQLQLGPMLSYGLVFEPGRDFAVADQGFTTGIQLLLYVAALPSVPLSVTVGADLRQRTDNPRFTQRLELAMKSNFLF